jgi:hypothetical protein
VRVRGTDEFGNAGPEECILLGAYDPSAGFVTGGWIDSPPGASTQFPNAVGKANFGFAAKYQKGANIPTGQTEFQFQAGNLNFHSEVYEWLVVAGARAQYKGSGTINGTGDYGFLLTAIDGDLLGGHQPDKFRIKIHDNNGGGIVYENQTVAASRPWSRAQARKACPIVRSRRGSCGGRPHPPSATLAGWVWFPSRSGVRVRSAEERTEQTEARDRLRRGPDAVAGCVATRWRDKVLDDAGFVLAGAPHPQRDALPRPRRIHRSTLTVSPQLIDPGLQRCSRFFNRRRGGQKGPSGQGSDGHRRPCGAFSRPCPPAPRVLP